MCITMGCEPQEAIFTVGSFLTCLVFVRYRVIPVTVEWQRRREVAWIIVPREWRQVRAPQSEST